MHRHRRESSAVRTCTEVAAEAGGIAEGGVKRCGKGSVGGSIGGRVARHGRRIASRHSSHGGRIADSLGTYSYSSLNWHGLGDSHGGRSRNGGRCRDRGRQGLYLNGGRCGIRRSDRYRGRHCHRLHIGHGRRDSYHSRRITESSVAGAVPQAEAAAIASPHGRVTHSPHAGVAYSHTDAHAVCLRRDGTDQTNGQDCKNSSHAIPLFLSVFYGTRAVDSLVAIAWRIALSTWLSLFGVLGILSARTLR